jgi:polyisoprenoid-binding protein YceI
MKLLILFFILFGLEARELSFEFKAKTNMPGVSVKGKSVKHISFNKEKKGRLEIDLKNITTDMELRDEHMREEVFNGKNLSIVYEEMDECQKNSDCDVSLKISINDQTIMKKVQFKRADENLSSSFILNLEEFGIKTPSKFGVRVLPDVEVKINFKN